MTTEADLKKIVGQRLQMLRLEKCLTQEQMGEKLNLSTSAYCKIEYAFKNGLFIDARYNISFINKLKKDLDYSAFADYVNGLEGMEGTISGETSVKMKDALGVQPKIRYSSIQFGIGFRF